MKSLIVILVILVASSEAQILDLGLVGNLVNPLDGLLSTTLQDVASLLLDLPTVVTSLLKVVSDLLNVMNLVLRGLGLAGSRSKRSVNDCQEHLDALNRVYNQTEAAVLVCQNSVASETESTKKVLSDARKRGNVVIEKTRTKFNTCNTKSDSWLCLYDIFLSGLNEIQSLVIPVRAQGQKYTAARSEASACFAKVQDDAIISANVHFQNAVQCYYRTKAPTSTKSSRSL